MLKNTERLENVIYQGGKNFSIKNVLTLGTKSGIGNRVDPIYSRTYNSTKYNDRNVLEVVRFNKNEYIVFGYNDFENKINEEIFISYPHMPFLISFLEECYELVNTEGVFTNNSVSNKYTDTIVESKEFASGKKMIAAPAVWDGKDQTIKKGIILYLNSEDIITTIDQDSLTSLCYMMANFNLGIASNQLFIMGMMNDIKLVPSQSSSPFSGQQSSNPVVNSGQPRRGLFSNSNGNKRTLGAGNRPNTNRFNNQQSNTHVVEQPPVEDTTLNEPQTQAPEQNNSNRRVSMNDIMSTADEIDVEDLGGVDI